MRQGWEKVIYDSAAARQQIDHKRQLGWRMPKDQTLDAERMLELAAGHEDEAESMR